MKKITPEISTQPFSPTGEWCFLQAGYSDQSLELFLDHLLQVCISQSSHREAHVVIAPKHSYYHSQEPAKEDKTMILFMVSKKMY